MAFRKGSDEFWRGLDVVASEQGLKIMYVPVRPSRVEVAEVRVGVNRFLILVNLFLLCVLSCFVGGIL